MVKMSEKTYQKLAEHLDRLPGGFGTSDSGADLRLLRRLFMPKEAELATYLTLTAEPVEAIAERAQLPVVETAHQLNEMAEKGLILSFQSAEGFLLYQAAPFVVGIYEFQVNRMNQGFLQDLEDYFASQQPRSQPVRKSIPQMRTIPIEQSIDLPLEALPYEQVIELVNAHDRFAVAPCICRRRARMTGDGCDAPEESCLIFGDFADFYVRTGRGRSIDKADVFELVDRANKANLVLNPTNSKFVSAICCCCGCCCGILRGLQSSPKPAEEAASAFIAGFDPDMCTDCRVCVERCQMQAMTVTDDRIMHDPDRCIGCGLCVSTCPSGALTLLRKPAKHRLEPPSTMQDTWRTIALDRTDSS
jgi:NAD-dependent dihydropyrimidine dehydrogenase PreA subunit